VSRHDFSRAENATKSTGALAPAEIGVSEGGGGFNPRIEPAESERALAPESLSPHALFQHSGKVVGFLVASLVPPEVELETIAVAVEAQRRGIGVLLLQALIKTLKTEPVDTLTLEVRASNQTALNFYQQNGLQQIARRPRYYANPEEDAILMRLNLINDRGHP
jgi:ribosomal-protein-alanine N-acetyltransferase